MHLHDKEGDTVDKRELRSFVARIKEGKCVLALGPRVAIRPDDPERRPLDELLAGELLKDVAASQEEIALCAGNLRRAADRYVGSEGDPFMLTTFAREFYAGQPDVTTEFHQNLAALPFQLCITASPDNLMAKAFTAADKKPQQGHYNFTGGKTPALSQPTPEKPIVYHLFGHYEDPASLVLTEVDLIRFLVSIVKGAPPLPDQVRGILNDPGVSCLFAGFGFHQWYLRVLLEVMNLYKSSRGLAFEEDAFFERPDHPRGGRVLYGDAAHRLSQVQVGTVRPRAAPGIRGHCAENSRRRSRAGSFPFPGRAGRVRQLRQ